MLKRLTSLLLVVVFIFSTTACSKVDMEGVPATKNNDMYYEEKELGGTSAWMRLSGIRLNSKKQIVVHDKGGETGVSKFITLDAAGKEISSFNCKQQVGEDKNTTRSLFTLDDKDNIYLLNEVIDVDEKKEGANKYFRVVHVYTSDGSLAKTLELGEGDGGINSILVDTKENIYISSMSGLKVYDQEGDLVNETDSVKFIAADKDDEGNFIGISLGQKKPEIVKYNPASGQNVWNKELKGNGDANVIYFSPIDKHVYISDSTGISKYDAQGNYVSQLLDYKDTSIIPIEQYISGFVVDEAETIYLTLLQQDYGNNEKLFKFYKYTLTKDDGSRKLLTISTLNKDYQLEIMAKKFQQQHPKIKVEIKNMIEEGRSISDEEIKKFNTEIINGKASDLISLDGLPYKKYIDKNIFVDLSELISKDSTFDTSKLYMNIVDAGKYKGKLYAMPVSFSYNAVQVDKALLDAHGIKLDENSWTWETFTEAALKMVTDNNGDGKTDIYGVAKTDPIKLFDYIFSSRIKQFIDMENKQSNFDSKEFVKLLEMVKKLSDKDVMHDKLDFMALSNGESSRGTIGFNLVDNMDNFYYTMTKYMMGDKAEVLAMPLDSEKVYRTFDANMYAINNKSKLKEEAWKFIKFLTSEDATLTNHTINKNAFENKIKETMKAENSNRIATYTDSGEMKITELEPISSEQFEQIKATISSLGQLNEYNLQLKSIIEGELKAYLSNQRSAEDVAKLIQNRVSIYLNE